MIKMVNFMKKENIVTIVNRDDGEAIVRLVLFEKADDTLNDKYIKDVCGVVERYLGYLDSSECTVLIPYKSRSDFGLCDTGNNVIVVKEKDTGRIWAYIRPYNTEKKKELFKDSLTHGVCLSVNKYYLALQKKAVKKNR